MQERAGNLTLISSVRTEQKTALANHPYHEMILALQTTLDIERLFELFSNHVQAVVAHSGYTFQSHLPTLTLKGGQTGRHACSYSLILEQENLGELAFTRGKRFSEMELATLEAFLCRLLYPLRNALQYQQALQLASLDPLTQTRNRGMLMSTLQREWELSRRHATPLSLILLDIDHFKRINDNYGHDQGDLVLKMVASCLKHRVRSSDMVFRYGGEEFVVLLSNTPKNGAYQLAERIRHALENMACDLEAGFPLAVTASLGVASLASDESKESLLQRADQAMYRSKRLGRNQVSLAP